MLSSETETKQLIADCSAECWQKENKIEKSDFFRDFFYKFGKRSEQIRDIFIASQYLRLKRYQMIICHVILKSKKFWNCARWQLTKSQIFAKLLDWKSNRVKNQETECNGDWTAIVEDAYLSRRNVDWLKKKHFPSKFYFWQRIESICRLK